MIFEWLFTFFVLYLLYKLIFNFIIPVSRASSQIRNKVNEMHQQQRQQHYTNESQNTKTGARPPADDYIDFEEIK
ncbi:MAG: hypothetical protein JO072_02105 [Parafilimonas sp.]|nr:hypothetical protein [Parafilimonas sp.]